MPSAFSLKSYAKINWTLRVLGKREDGFHELFTLFQTVSLHDTVHFGEGQKLELTCDDPRIPTDDSNLIIKAAKLLDEGGGAKIRLEKQIPSPGGLGGGSSNAAVALIGLARLWEIEVPNTRLMKLAAELGSDVPFFIEGGSALGTGRGEEIEEAPDISSPYLLIVTPDAAVTTAGAFGRLDAPALTSETLKSSLTVCRNVARNFDPYHSALINDLEASVFEAYPEVKRVKETLLSLGARNAAMSGSGASVFAVFDNEETRQAALKALGTESTWRKFAVSTISRTEYREALGI